MARYLVDEVLCGRYLMDIRVFFWWSVFDKTPVPPCLGTRVPKWGFFQFWIPIFYLSQDSSIGSLVTDSALLKNTTIQHSERLATLKTKDGRYEHQYIANAIYCIVWKYCDIAIFRKYRDILTIFSVHAV